MSFIVNLRSDLSLKGFPPKREPGSSVHVAGGVEDNNLEPGTNLDNNNTNQNFTLRLFTDPGKQSLGGRTPPLIRNKDSIFILGDDSEISDSTDIGFNIDGSNTNQGFRFNTNIDPNDQSLNGNRPQEYNTKNSIFIFGDESGLNDTDIIGFQNTNTNQNLRFSQGVDPTNLSLGGRTPTFIRNKDSIFLYGDDSQIPDDTDIGFNIDGSNTNQGFRFNTNIDPGNQSLGGRTPTFIRNKNSIFLYGDDSDFPDDTEIGFNIDGSNTNQGFQFEEGVDPGDNSLGGKTPLKFIDTSYTQHVDNPTDPSKVLGIGVEVNTVEPRSRTNTILEQIGVLASRRIDDVALITTKAVNPIENPRLITNQGILALAQALNASFKVSKKDKLSTYDKAAREGELDIVKTTTGIISSTPVAGTGLHLLFPPAVNNQYLQQNDNESTGLLNTVSEFTNRVTGGITGVTAGSGINGANQAYTQGQVQKGFVDSNFVELESDNNKVKDVKKNSKHERDESDITFLSPRNNPVDLLYTFASSSGKIEDTYVSTVRLGAPPLQNKVNIDAQSENIFIRPFGSEKFVESIGLRTKLVSTGVDKKNSLDLMEIESINFGDESIINVVDDIIPFNIEIYDPQQPAKYSLIKLRAYLDSMNDNYTGEWNGTKYIGRAEQLYNYTGFNRDFSFAFKVAALSKEELLPLYNKLNTLVGTTAPNYDDEQNFMQGIFVKLTIGDYLHKVPGFFEKIGLTWDTKYPWELGLYPSKKTHTTMYLLPHILNVDVSFRPIHDFNPKYGSKYIGKQRDLRMQNYGDRVYLRV